MTLAGIIQAIEADKPATVAMTTSEHTSLDAVSIFFVGPKGQGACPLYGISAAIADGTVDQLILEAVETAESLA